MQQIVHNNTKLLTFPKEWIDEIDHAMDIISNNKELTDFFFNTSALISESAHPELFEYLTDGGETGGIPHTMWALVCVLHALEGAKGHYLKKGIPLNVFLDTMRDIYIWTKEWHDTMGAVGLFEIGWLLRHIDLHIFRLGRLEFEMIYSDFDSEQHGIEEGSALITVHIPKDGRLDTEECMESYAKAKEFFKTYYADYQYEAFICHSWLLDPRLKTFLNENSNIINFQNQYQIIRIDDGPKEVMMFVFQINRAFDADLEKLNAETTLEKGVLDYMKSGGMLGAGLGILK